MKARKSSSSKCRQFGKYSEISFRVRGGSFGGWGKCVRGRGGRGGGQGNVSEGGEGIEEARKCVVSKNEGKNTALSG